MCSIGILVWIGFGSIMLMVSFLCLGYCLYLLFGGDRKIERLSREVAINTSFLAATILFALGCVLIGVAAQSC